MLVALLAVVPAADKAVLNVQEARTIAVGISSPKQARAVRTTMFRASSTQHWLQSLWHKTKSLAVGRGGEGGGRRKRSHRQSPSNFQSK
jgi:hypothetical protein